MPTTAIRGNLAGIGSVGQLQGISIGGMTGPIGSSMGFHLRAGVMINLTEGIPAAPELQMIYPNQWRFKWQIRVGFQTIRISVRQVENITPRPTLTVKADPSLGINADVVATAASDAGWVVVGPAIVTATAAGAVYVELSNNVLSKNAVCEWDNLIAT